MTIAPDGQRGLSPGAPPDRGVLAAVQHDVVLIGRHLAADERGAGSPAGLDHQRRSIARERVGRECHARSRRGHEALINLSIVGGVHSEIEQIVFDQKTIEDVSRQHQAGRHADANSGKSLGYTVTV